MRKNTNSNLQSTRLVFTRVKTENPKEMQENQSKLLLEKFFDREMEYLQKKLRIVDQLTKEELITLIKKQRELITLMLEILNKF